MREFLYKYKIKLLQLYRNFQRFCSHFRVSQNDPGSSDLVYQGGQEMVRVGQEVVHDGPEVVQGDQGFVKGEEFCFRYCEFYFSQNTACQTSWREQQTQSQNKQSSSPLLPTHFWVDQKRSRVDQKWSRLDHKWSIVDRPNMVQGQPKIVQVQPKIVQGGPEVVQG